MSRISRCDIFNKSPQGVKVKKYTVQVLNCTYDVFAPNELGARIEACLRFKEDTGMSMYEYDGSVRILDEPEVFEL